MASVSMAVNLGGIQMKNPVCTASGTFGNGWQFEGFWASRPCPGTATPRRAWQSCPPAS